MSAKTESPRGREAGHDEPESPAGESQALEISEETLRPEAYPWQPIDRSGVLVENRFLPTNAVDGVLDEFDARPMAERHRVLSVGSNASFEVMHRKMARSGVTSPLPMTIARHEGIAVGHSAHVSLPGYIAAAPYRCARCVRPFVAVHLDDEQLEVLDATEPNYTRLRHEGAWFYASRWQVLAVRGTPVSLRTQEDLHMALAVADPAWQDRFGGSAGASVTSQLSHDGTVNEWRHHWQSAGLIRDAGF